MSVNMAFGFPKEIEKAKAEKWPVLIPVGTMEFHTLHLFYFNLLAVDRVCQRSEGR